MTEQSLFGDFIRMTLELVQLVIPVISGLALLAFLWGLVRFILRVGGDETAITEGKDLMKWGLIALFVMFSLYGLLRFMSGELGFTQFGLPLLPQ